MQDPLTSLRRRAPAAARRRQALYVACLAWNDRSGDL